jgi:DNA-binding MarR family transcriptional regulator
MLTNYNKPEYLKTLKNLILCFQSYEKLANQNFSELGLTSSQFDIIATLGNTNGMLCKDLGEKTFITKGTLTGVLDRLEEKKLLIRLSVDTDRRAQLIKLTNEGQALFEIVFPAHLNFMKNPFDDMGDETINNLNHSCEKALVSFNRFLTK